MAYRKGIVYFIDILGTKARTSDSDGFDKSYFIADLFLKEMEGVQKRHRQTSMVDRAVFTFSDCAYIVYALKETVEDSYENKMRMVYQSLFNTQQVICNFVYNGFLCRGGISYGDVYFDLNRNMIFGSAVNKAYSIESKEAIYPNIVIEKNLAEEIQSYSENIKQNVPMSALDGDILGYNQNIKQYFFNYLNYFFRIGSVQLGKSSINFEEFYNKVLQDYYSELNKYSGDTDFEKRIREKLDWHFSYLNQMKSIIDNDSFGEDDLRQLFLGNR